MYLTHIGCMHLITDRLDGMKYSDTDHIDQNQSMIPCFEASVVSEKILMFKDIH